MGKKRGEYNKNQARNDIKDFIVEIYKKYGVSNLQKLQEEQFHDLYIQYTKLIKALNDDEVEKNKKSYKIRDAGSKEDFLYFYREATRHVDKKKITKIDKNEQKLKYLRGASRVVEKHIKNKKEDLAQLNDEEKKQEEKIQNNADIINRALVELGAYGLFQVNNLRQYENSNYYQKKMDTKLQIEQLIQNIVSYYNHKVSLAMQEDNQKLSAEVIKSFSELLKGYNEFQSGCKFDITMPKEMVTLIQNNISNQVLSVYNKMKTQPIFVEIDKKEADEVKQELADYIDNECCARCKEVNQNDDN